jgi:hypothetical protein
MSALEVMQAVANGFIKPEEAASLISGKAPAKLSMKVSDKGALSLYGMGRFPVTLYREQWECVLGHGDEIKTFITANAGKLTTKAAA